MALSRQGDGPALQTLARYQDRLARALAMLINIYDPDIIVLGGGLSNINEIYFGLNDKVAAHAFTTDRLETKILKTNMAILAVSAAPHGWEPAQNPSEHSSMKVYQRDVLNNARMEYPKGAPLAIFTSRGFEYPWSAQATFLMLLKTCLHIFRNAGSRRCAPKIS